MSEDKVKFSTRLKFFRLERPSEFLMDDFVKDAERLEKRVAELEAKVGVIDSEDLKTLCTDFYYWWHNQPGTNTQDGFDQWCRERCLHNEQPASGEKENE